VYSLVIPIYKNEESLAELIDAVAGLKKSLSPSLLEVIFVVDGSPDNSYARLKDLLPKTSLSSQLILLSKNFGSFAAIRAGLKEAKGQYSAVMAADLQEPPELIVEFFQTLALGEHDVVVGVRGARMDPWLSRTSAQCFWWFYKKFVQPEMPKGGVDIFACNKVFREALLSLDESHSSLVGLILWMGFRRKTIEYTRQVRKFGKSAWTFKKKLTYLFDSLFSFSDLPVRLMMGMGVFGLCVSFVLGAFIFGARLSGVISVPGYAATALIVLFFAALNCFGLGVVSSYTWRTFENTKGRPASLVLKKMEFNAHD
jgi:polyisoprenyl-phosphate glycosyltransferase